MSSLRAIIFDFDGVIADTEPLHYHGFRQVLETIGIPLSEQDYYANYLGFDDRGAFQAALTADGRPVTDEAVAALMRQKATAYLAAVKNHVRIFPGVVELVRSAAARMPLAIASGALRGEIELILEVAGLRACFRHITSAEDVSRGKPNPECFQLALAALNRERTAQGTEAIVPADCLVIEDSMPGIRGGKAAGMKVLGVATTHSLPELTIADAAVQSLTDTSVDDLNRRLWGASAPQHTRP
ncbi:MAG: HAD family phosphatase [Nitrospiraceae bacterium]